ncbi:MAG: carbohydrate kinase family protein [Lachnospiraceae bacterium]|nr:carbohydrate kinase family protein [Lachnospiraceae bacterium]
MSEKNKKYDVICIGQVVQDILTTNVPENAFMLDKDTVIADSLTLTSGGDAANEAVVLARLGERSALLSRVDKRNVGNMIYEDMKREGVDVSLLRQVDDCETFTSLVFIHPSGDHNFIVGPGRNYTPERADFDMEIFKDTRAVSAASLFALGELDTNGIEEIFQVTKSAGGFTIADMNFDLQGIGPHAVDKAYPYTDYLMPSFNEAVYVTGKKDPDEIADYFLAKGVKNVLLKMGGEGCFFKNAEERFFVDPYDIKPVDTTGCGDNFVAAFIHCLLKGMDNRACAEFASAVGAINSQGVGAHMQIQSERQVLDYMKTAKKRVIDRK